VRTVKPTVDGPPKKPLGNGKLLSTVVPAYQLKNDWMKVILYGENRVGKTTWACQFPKPALVVSFEPGGKAGGATSIKKIPEVYFKAMESTQMAIELAAELREANCPYPTVIIDAATTLQELALKEILGLDNIPVQLNWGTVSDAAYRERSEKAKAVLQQYVHLPCHVVIVALEKDHAKRPREEGGKLTRQASVESKIAADLGEATVKWLHNCCDFILHMSVVKEVIRQKRVDSIGGKTSETIEEVETGKLARRLRTIIHPNYAAGVRSSSPETVPEFIEGRDPGLMYREFMRIVKGA
jgi:hypothetical protein